MIRTIPIALMLLTLAACFEVHGAQGQSATPVILTGDTMAGNEVTASNGVVILKVRGLYQQMFSAKWQMGIKLTPLRDLTISRVTSHSFTGRDIRLKDYENTFRPPSGSLRMGVEREIDIPWIHPAASMLITIYDDKRKVVGTFRISQIADHMIGHGWLPAESREAFDNAR